MILLDTSLLSLAFRRRPPSHEPPAVTSFRRLVEADAPVAIPGIVLQELLSGLRTDAEVARLQTLLEGFPIILADRRDHVAAAGIANACRRHGVSVSTIDCLIAALTTGRNAALFTLDADFERMRRHCDLRLFPASPVTRR